MVNQELVNYVREQTQKGRNKEEIKEELLKEGWQGSDVQEVLGISGVPKPPAPPTPKNHEATGLQHLNPKAVWLFFIRWVFIFLVISLFLVFEIIITLFDVIFLPAILIILAAIIFAFIWAKLTYRFYLYELTEEGFRKEYGVIIKKYVTIPYERIQNVNILRGVLDRLLGLSSLKIFTAGTGGSGVGGAEGLLPGLSKDTAEELRNELVHRSRQSKSQEF